MQNFLNKIFKLEENKTTVRAEIIGGVTTFVAMCYIVIVNPSQMTGFNPALSNIWNAAFVGGIIAAVIATLIMAFVANKPFALAAGMGLNSFFFVSFIAPVVASGVFTNESAVDAYGAGLAAILISGVLFLILSVTGLRKHIATSLPQCMKKAIPAGIGLFIALIGFKNAGIVVSNMYTYVAIADFQTWKTAAPCIAAFVGLIAIVFFASRQNKVMKYGSVIFGIAITTALYFIFGLEVSITETSLSTVFKDFGEVGFFNLQFKTLFDGKTIGSILSVVMIILTYSLVDMFDTMGTIYGTAAQADLIDENGDPLNLQECMLADSVGTVAGAVLGTSTVTTFVESASGVGAGARTGLASVVTAFLLAVCLFFAPIAQYIPTVATAPALIYVGLLMCKNIIHVDFSDLTQALPGFLGFIMMPLTYSISNGIMVSAIAYVILTLLSGKYKKQDIVVTVIAVLSILRFAFVTM